MSVCLFVPVTTDCKHRGFFVHLFSGTKRGEGIRNREKGKGERFENLYQINSREILNLRQGEKNVEPSGLSSPNSQPRLAGFHAWEVMWTISFSKK